MLAHAQNRVEVFLRFVKLFHLEVELTETIVGHRGSDMIGAQPCLLDTKGFEVLELRTSKVPLSLKTQCFVVELGTIGYSGGLLVGGVDMSIVVEGHGECTQKWKVRSQFCGL